MIFVVVFVLSENSLTIQVGIRYFKIVYRRWVSMKRLTVVQNSTFIITAGAAGSLGYSSTEFWAADDCYFFECARDVILDKFLFYALDSQQERILGMVRKASIPRLGRSSIENLSIPIPPLPVQERIVSILDSFSAICNNLIFGLPAEITARQKQYEYYRDKLLTFKELDT